MKLSIFINAARHWNHALLIAMMAHSDAEAAVYKRHRQANMQRARAFKEREQFKRYDRDVAVQEHANAM